MFYSTVILLQISTFIFNGCSLQGSRLSNHLQLPPRPPLPSPPRESNHLCVLLLYICESSFWSNRPHLCLCNRLHVFYVCLMVHDPPPQTPPPPPPPPPPPLPLLVLIPTHRGLVGPVHRSSVLGPLDVSGRLGPAGHTGQVVRSPGHQQELRGAVHHRVLGGNCRRNTATTVNVHQKGEDAVEEVRRRHDRHADTK